MSEELCYLNCLKVVYAYQHLLTKYSHFAASRQTDHPCEIHSTFNTAILRLACVPGISVLALYPH